MKIQGKIALTCLVLILFFYASLTPSYYRIQTILMVLQGFDDAALLYGNQLNLGINVLWLFTLASAEREYILPCKKPISQN